MTGALRVFQACSSPLFQVFTPVTASAQMLKLAPELELVRPSNAARVELISGFIKPVAPGLSLEENGLHSVQIPEWQYFSPCGVIERNEICAGPHRRHEYSE